MSGRSNTRKFFKGYTDFLGPFGAGRLSPQAQALLVALLCQYDGHNNGSLKLAATVLTRVWRSSDRRTRAKRELMEYGFVFLTKRGYQRATGENRNMASLYAVACYPLNSNPQHDPELVAQFNPTAWRDRVVAVPNTAQVDARASAESGTASAQTSMPNTAQCCQTMPNTALSNAALCRPRHSGPKSSMPPACHLLDVYPSRDGPGWERGAKEVLH